MADKTEITIILDAQGNPMLKRVNKSIDDQNKKIKRQRN